MRLSPKQRRIINIVAVLLLVAGVAPWPSAVHSLLQKGSSQTTARKGKCPAGYSGKLPTDHPAIPGIDMGGSRSTWGSEVPRYPITAKERELLDWLSDQQHRTEALVAKLVNIDSGTGDVAGVSRVAEAVASHLKEAGIAVEIERPTPEGAAGNIVRARVVSDPAAPRTLLLAHMVDCKGNVALIATLLARLLPSPGRHLPWTRHPLRSRTTPRPIFLTIPAGRSPVNTLQEGLHKFGCAGAGCNVEALLTSDEEVGSPVSGPYIRAASLGATAVFNVEGGDVAPEDGESPDGSVTVARKASLLLTVEVQGKAAHASNPLEGASAIEAMALKIADLRKLTNFKMGVEGVNGVDGTTLNVGTISGGTKFNIIPAEATAEVNIRAWTAAEMVKLKEGVRAVMERTHLARTTGRVVRESSAFEPMEQTPNTMRLFGYYSALSGLLGVNVTADRRGGAADSSISSAAGAPTLCSVGALGGRAHSDGEFLVLRSLVTRAQALALAIVRLSKAPLPVPLPSPSKNPPTRVVGGAGGGTNEL